jgi:hypothetical protein
MTVFDTNSRRAVVYGILAIAALFIAAFAAIALAALLPRTLITFFLITLGLLLLAAITWLAYHTLALANIDYALDRNAFVIRHGPVREIIPMGNVQRVIAASDIAAGLKHLHVPLPGWWIGQGYHPELGKITFYANSPLEKQVIIVTPDENYAISPRNRDEFLEAFRVRFQMGPTQSVQAVRLMPPLFRSPIWTDRMAITLIVIALALNALLFAVGFARYPELNAQVILHFNAQGIPDRFGSPEQVFGPAIIATELLVINFLIALTVYLRGDKLAAYLASGGTILVQVLFLIAVVTVAFTVSAG